MYRRNSSIVTVACLASLLVVIIFLNFRVTTSVSESNFYSKAKNHSIEVSQFTQRQAQMAVVVIGSGIIADTVRSELSQLIAENQDACQQVVLMEGEEIPSGMPVLEVELVPHGIVWTPVASFANIEWQVRYVHSGSLNTNANLSRVQSAKSSLGSLWLRESSLGLMTWHGYRDYIGQIAAKQLNQILSKQLSSQTLALAK